MRDLAYEMREVLGRGDVEGIGALLDRNWELKRSLVDGLSDTKVDGWYRQARHAGATGGKLLGAGAGGFLLIMADRSINRRCERRLATCARYRSTSQPAEPRSFIWNEAPSFHDGASTWTSTWVGCAQLSTDSRVIA